MVWAGGKASDRPWRQLLAERLLGTLRKPSAKELSTCLFNRALSTPSFTAMSISLERFPADVNLFVQMGIP